MGRCHEYYHYGNPATRHHMRLLLYGVLSLRAGCPNPQTIDIKHGRGPKTSEIPNVVRSESNTKSSIDHWSLHYVLDAFHAVLPLRMAVSAMLSRTIRAASDMDPVFLQVDSDDSCAGYADHLLLSKPRISERCTTLVALLQCSEFA